MPRCSSGSMRAREGKQIKQISCCSFIVRHSAGPSPHSTRYLWFCGQIQEKTRKTLPETHPGIRISPALGVKFVPPLGLDRQLLLLALVGKSSKHFCWRPMGKFS